MNQVWSEDVDGILGLYGGGVDDHKEVVDSSKLRAVRFMTTDSLGF